MKHWFKAILVATLGFVAVQPGEAAVTVDWDPVFMWQAGATPTNSPAGGELIGVGLVSHFGPPLDFLDASDPTKEYTIYMYGLISEGTVPTGPIATQFYTTQYTGGFIEVYEDLTPDASFDSNPPNGTVPANFTDGTLLLSGVFTSFETNTNNFTMFKIGNAEGEVQWTGGTLLNLWANNQGDQCPGLFTGGLTWRTDVVPAGYLFRHDGKLDLNCLNVGDMDIHPTSCPNPINVGSNGLTPVALLGSPTFDLSKVELSSILLQGIAPVKIALGDASQPVPNRTDVCDCTTAGPDGFDDLLLKFKTSDLVSTFGPVQNGDILVLTLTGNLLFDDHTQGFEAKDCIRIVVGGGGGGTSAQSVQLAVTQIGDAGRGARITYAVPERMRVRLEVHDVTGRVVGRLLDEWMPGGEHQLNWDAGDLSSGVYFVRMHANEESAVRRFVLRR